MERGAVRRGGFRAIVVRRKGRGRGVGGRDGVLLLQIVFYIIARCTRCVTHASADDAARNIWLEIRKDGSRVQVSIYGG